MVSDETMMTDKNGEPYLDLRITVSAPKNKKMESLTNWMTVFVENISESKRSKNAHVEAYGCFWVKGMGNGNCSTQEFPKTLRDMYWVKEHGQFSEKSAMTSHWVGH